MGGSSQARAKLAERLNQLKQRSGYSYVQIANKTHFSRSTVHRYCSGQSVPSTFGGVERIAGACGADQEELARLFRLWERALSEHPSSDEAELSTTPAQAPVSSDAVPAGPPHTRSAHSRHGRRRWALLGLVSVLLVLSPSGFPPTPSSDVTEPQRRNDIGARMWTNIPERVEPEFIGATLNSSTGLMPDFELGSLRLWDSRTRWQNIEPAPGQYDWSILDRLVTNATEAGLPMMFAFGGTPKWASPSSPPSVYSDDARAAPPDNLDHWARFVRAVAERYRGRIGAYELWDMANHPKFFNSSTDVLVEMTRRANIEISRADPEATVACPTMTELWEPAARRALERFGELGGYEHCDVAAVKLHPRSASEPPETMLTLAHKIEKSLQKAGVRPPIWSTGPSYESPYDQAVPAELAPDYAARFFLTGIYAKYERMYFYNWGNGKIPLVLQPAGGPPTEAARHVEQLHGWLATAKVRSCRQGEQGGLPPGLWQCEFESGGKRFVIRWTMQGTVKAPAPEWANTVKRLDGTQSTIRPGTEMTVTGSPILLR